jgi:hypothetical protein
LIFISSYKEPNLKIKLSFSKQALFFNRNTATNIGKTITINESKKNVKVAAISPLVEILI